MHKHYQEADVWDAATDRLDRVFGEFERVYVSFSAGKDSSVLVHLALDAARRAGRLPLDVLFIDLEAQYRATLHHAREVMALPGVRPHWIALPMNLRNSVSVFQPHWLCWDPDARERWVRPLPEGPGVVSDPGHFPFFRVGMEFEEFVPAFGASFAGESRTACLIGIRSDESLNRYRTIASDRKERYRDWAWSTRLREDMALYNVYPIYDWRTEDIWTAVGRNKWPYNRIYDGMYQAGKSIHESRICQPFGDDQRKGLDLFRKLEPETWARVVNRVAGANYGNVYCGTALVGHRKVPLPPGHTWRSYTEFLLATMPRFEAEWYRGKFAVFLKWWAAHGYPEIPDEADPHLEAQRKVPSYRRLAKCLVKNDRLCKSLSFAQTTGQYSKYLHLLEVYGE